MVFLNIDNSESLILARDSCIIETGIELSKYTFLAVTLKPWCSSEYEKLPLSNQKDLLCHIWFIICHRYKIQINGLHFETFKNGNVHAHGYLVIPITENIQS